MLWYVLVDADGDPASISSAPIPSFPAGWSVVQVESAGQPDLGEWFDPVSGGSVMAPRRWDRASRSWTTLMTPTVMDRVLDDLANDPALVDVWQRLTAAQRTALRSRLSALLGRRRYRYVADPVDLGD
jgi:hypothetical protein